VFDGVASCLHASGDTASRDGRFADPVIPSLDRHMHSHIYM
jgi:hypothetical protein